MRPADLAGQTLLLTETGCGYRIKFDRIMALQGIRPGNVTEFTSVEAMKECVLMGMGLALLPAIVVRRELRQNQLIALPWSGPSLDIGAHMIWHKDKWISPAMAALMELMKGGLDEGEAAISERSLSSPVKNARHRMK